VSNERGSTVDPTTDNAADPSGSGNSNEGATNPQAGDAPAPPKRRKRGPNKAKPGTFVVETKARMKQEEIIKLLVSHAVTQLGGDVANNMTLQVDDNGECRPLADVLPQGATLQFGTALKTAD